MVYYCHRFLPHIAATMAPLYAALTGKPKTLTWTSSHAVTFHKAKRAISDAAYLSFPTPGLPSSCPPMQATSPSVPSSNKSFTAPSNLSPSSVESSRRLSQDTPPSTGNCSLSTPSSVTTVTSSKGHPSPSRQTTCCLSTPSPRNRTLILPVNSVTCRYPSSTAPCNMFLGKKNPVADALSRNSIASVCVGLDYNLLACLQQQDPEMPSCRTSLTALRFEDIPFGWKTSPTTTATPSSATSAPAALAHGSLFSFVNASSTSSTAWHTPPLDQQQPS